MRAVIIKPGVTFDWRGASLDGVVQVARAADELGYGSFWIPEAWGFEGFAACAHILNQTEQIKVRTGILNVYSRSAALIGMGCLSLLQIAPQRFSLGLGTSGGALVEGWHGVKFYQPLERMREYVEVIKKVVSGEVVDYTGKLLTLSRFRVYTEIPQSDEFKIYLAALGDRSIRLAGEISDGAIIIFYSMRRLDHALEQLNFTTNGKTRELIAMIAAEVTEDLGQKERRLYSLKKRIAFYISSMGEYYAKTLTQAGFAFVVEEVKEAYRRGEREKAVAAVTQELVDQLCLIGSAKEVRDKLEALPHSVTPVLGLKISSGEEIRESINSLKLLAQH